LRCHLLSPLEATGGQILIAQRLCAEVEDDVEVEPVGERTLKGFQRPVAAFNVIAVGVRRGCRRSPALNAANDDHRLAGGSVRST